MLGGLGCGGALRCPKTGTGGQIWCLRPRSPAPCRLHAWYSSRLPSLLRERSQLLPGGVPLLLDKRQPLLLSRTLLFAISVESGLLEAARQHVGAALWLSLEGNTAGA